MKHKVLIADDDDSIRRLIQRVFSDQIVLTAADGQAALLLIAAERPALVILDLNMPLLGGLDVLRALKGAVAAPLCIMLTGNEELETAHKALELGAASYMTKPFDTGEIRNVVLSALEQKEEGKKISASPWRVKKSGSKPPPAQRSGAGDQTHEPGFMVAHNALKVEQVRAEKAAPGLSRPAGSSR